jgi:hypothetical protein
VTVDAKDELLRELETFLRGAISEDEFGNEYVCHPYEQNTEATEVIADAIGIFERARVAGLVTYPVPE